MNENRILHCDGKLSICLMMTANIFAIYYAGNISNIMYMKGFVLYYSIS